MHNSAASRGPIAPSAALMYMPMKAVFSTQRSLGSFWQVCKSMFLLFTENIYQHQNRYLSPVAQVTIHWYRNSEVGKIFIKNINTGSQFQQTTTDRCTCEGATVILQFGTNEATKDRFRRRARKWQNDCPCWMSPAKIIWNIITYDLV